MQKHPLSVSYIFFYLLFSEDTWRIGAGFVFAVLLGPQVTHGRALSRGAEVIVWLMIMAIGWSITAWPARKISAALRRAVTQTKQ
jgi:hypothetical protein